MAFLQSATLRFREYKTRKNIYKQIENGEKYGIYNLPIDHVELTLGKHICQTSMAISFNTLDISKQIDVYNTVISYMYLDIPKGYHGQLVIDNKDIINEQGLVIDNAIVNSGEYEDIRVKIRKTKDTECKAYMVDDLQIKLEIIKDN